MSIGMAKPNCDGSLNPSKNLKKITPSEHTKVCMLSFLSMAGLVLMSRYPNRSLLITFRTKIFSLRESSICWYSDGRISILVLLSV